MTRPTPNRLLGPISRRGVSDLAPLLVMAGGWFILALLALPWIRDSLAAVALRGITPSLRHLQHPPVAFLAALIGGMLLPVAGSVWLLRSCRREDGFGAYLARLVPDERRLGIILAMVAAVLSISVLARGEPSLGDTSTHVARAWAWMESVRTGALPTWTDLWYGGTPVDDFYSPLAHVLQGLLWALGWGEGGSAKLLAWLCRIAGSVGFALFACRLHRDRRSGIVGGMLYALMPAFHGAWMWQGRPPGVLLLAIVPWCFVVAEQLVTTGGGLRRGALLSLLVGLLLSAHAPDAQSPLRLLAGFIVVRLVPGLIGSGPRVRRDTITGLLAAAVGTTAIAFAMFYPMWREMSLVDGIAGQARFRIGLGVPSLSRLRSLFPGNPWAGSYIGASSFILAATGIMRAALESRGVDRRIGPLALALFAILPFMLTRSGSRWHDPLAFGAIVAAAALVRRHPLRPAADHSSAARPWQRRPVRRLAKALVQVALFLPLVDQAPFVLTSTYASHRGGRRIVYRSLENHLGGHRYLDVPPGAVPHVVNIWTFATDRTLPALGGPFPQGAPVTSRYAMAVIDTLCGTTAARHPLASEVRFLLALHDVRLLVSADRFGEEVPTGASLAELPYIPECRAHVIPEASPVCVLQRPIPEGPPAPGASLGMHGLPSPTARRSVEEQILWMRLASPLLVPDVGITIVPNRMTLTLPDLGCSTLRIARNAWPSTRVRLDGQAISWEPGPLGGMLVDVPVGPHRLEIEGCESAPRRQSRRAIIVSVFVLAGVALVPSRRSTGAARIVRSS